MGLYFSDSEDDNLFDSSNGAVCGDGGDNDDDDEDLFSQQKLVEQLQTGAPAVSTDSDDDLFDSLSSCIEQCSQPSALATLWFDNDDDDSDDGDSDLGDSDGDLFQQSYTLACSTTPTPVVGPDNLTPSTTQPALKPPTIPAHVVPDALDEILRLHRITSKPNAMPWDSCVFKTALLPATRNRQWLIGSFSALLSHIASSVGQNQACRALLRCVSAPGYRSAAGSTDRVRSLSYRSSGPFKRNLSFVRLIVVVGCSLDSIAKDRVMSKRDIYYRHPVLFGHQKTVDSIVDVLSHTLKVPRMMLHITAAAKGLCVGACRIFRSDGTCSTFTDREGSLIQRTHPTDHVDMSKVQWALVIEKEACFRSLSSSSLGSGATINGMLITGKGQPDLSTRSLVNTLSLGRIEPKIPIFTLVDLDPAGLSIYLTYKYGGSQIHEHEVANLAAPTLRWLGPRIDHLLGPTSTPSGWIPMIDRDRKLAVGLLCRPVCAADGPEQDVRLAAQTLLMLNLKAEIQAVEADNSDLSVWTVQALIQAGCPVRSSLPFWPSPSSLPTPSWCRPYP